MFQILLRRISNHLPQFLLLFAFPAVLSAIDAGMPNPPGHPTVVRVDLFLADIINMDELNESFEIELILAATWDDPRLAFDSEAEGVGRKIYQGEFQFNEVFTGWWPQFLILNEIGSGDTNAIKIEVYPDGAVRYLEQRNVTLETPMSLKRFPFDEQTLKAYIIAFGDGKREVILEADENLLSPTDQYSKNNRKVNIAQWDLKGIHVEAGDVEYRYYGEDQKVSQLILSVDMKRKSANIIWKVIVPLIILVSMMWAVFWMNTDDLPDRLNISFIGILTIVAYQFLIDGNMPRISYFTFTDAVLLFSFVIMVGTIFQSLIVYNLSKNGRQAIAHRIDVISRCGFPIVYFLVLLGCYLNYIR
ncbi:hypothetical protein [Rubellicoccus peritrichatus]|uniref:Neurotransmitter-gated ion-channel ligand-binding domain-containing protein n=1 Tax=Rubellicoccus peritrichatus TaxID=3080537 RepID=A0AAQ3QX06_9BACT|nr:hypothetical protein [Puniceicoccus sp. CR14]WOO42405.1 hypothetical protein RZN69_04835 [Puniceicoccus sp. CR14]